MDTERGIDVLIVVAGWDTIELNSVDVVCKRIDCDEYLGSSHKKEDLHVKC